MLAVVKIIQVVLRAAENQLEGCDKIASKTFLRTHMGLSRDTPKGLCVNACWCGLLRFSGNEDFAVL